MTNLPNPGKHGKLYDASGVAAATCYTRSNIHGLINAGKFPSPAVVFNRGKNLEKGYLWREEDILAWTNLSKSQKWHGEGANAGGAVRIEDYATGDSSGLIVCTITGGAYGFLSAAKSAEYSAGGLTREKAAEVALKAAQGASRAEA